MACVAKIALLSFAAVRGFLAVAKVAHGGRYYVAKRVVQLEFDRIDECLSAYPAKRGEF